MALINCPECSGQVSTQALACPHCGYPMQTPAITTPNVQVAATTNECKINGVLIDCTEIFNAAMRPETKIQAIALCRESTGCGVSSAKNFVELIIRTKKIPDSFQMSDATINIHRPQCPTCHSTNVEKLRMGTRAIDGFFFGKLSPEARAQFWCKDCNYRW